MVCLCGLSQTQRRINRNILECKDEYLVGNAVEIGVLIETYWNVKISSTGIARFWQEY